MLIEERIIRLGITLPEAPLPVGSYVPALATGTLLFLSGILPFKDGALIAKGVVGRDVDLETARISARQVVINALSIIKKNYCLESLKRCIRLNGYIASDTSFYDQPSVLNEASNLIRAVFEEDGGHTRVAVGVAVLPLNSPVEIDFIFELCQNQ